MSAAGGLLDGKKILVTGVLNDDSIAFGVARLAQEQGAEIVLTSFARAMSLTRRTARRLSPEPDVVELDVTNPEHLAALTGDLTSRWGRVDGVLHAVAFAPSRALGGNFLATEWDDVALTMNTSAFSLKALAVATLPLMQEGGGSIVGLDFDAGQAWPAYDWMGVAKAALESTSRYLARDLGQHGIRVNLVSAGPIRSVAARGIPGFSQMEGAWAGRSPLGWDTRDTAPVAKACVALLSDWFPATTGEILHVDGGFHAMAAPGLAVEPPE
ncbi:MAG TPA: enoyl-ACP reductase FabI [Acidimicrobiales bacterium]|nr:enoyl-ACP reductase FabI [Acidimicrobiales bacterium]